MNKVMLRIDAKQEGRQGEENVMELVTNGQSYSKDGITYLVYEESELSGMEGCVTTLMVEEGVVTLKRHGAASHELRFEQGKKFKGLYETPMGLFDMEILTDLIKNKLNSDATEGSLEIEYEISLRGLMEARNKMNIEILNVVQ